MARRLSLAAGALLVAVGVAGALAPVLVAGVSLSTTVILLVGVLAGVGALRTANRRRHVTLDYATLPRDGSPPENARPPQSFGAELAADIDAAAHPRRRTRRDRLRNRLRTDVVDALVARGDSPNAAREALENGTWTTDAYAAVFFAPDESLPLRASLRLSLTGRRFDTQVAHVAAELDRLTEVA